MSLINPYADNNDRPDLTIFRPEIADLDELETELGIKPKATEENQDRDPQIKSISLDMRSRANNEPLPTLLKDTYTLALKHAEQLELTATDLETLATISDYEQDAFEQMDRAQNPNPELNQFERQKAVAKALDISIDALQTRVKRVKAKLKGLLPISLRDTLGYANVQDSLRVTKGLLNSRIPNIDQYLSLNARDRNYLSHRKKVLNILADEGIENTNTPGVNFAQRLIDSLNSDPVFIELNSGKPVNQGTLKDNLYRSLNRKVTIFDNNASRFENGAHRKREQLFDVIFPDRVNRFTPKPVEEPNIEKTLKERIAQRVTRKAA